MATSPNHCGTYDYRQKLKTQSGDSKTSKATQATHDMEVKGHLITGPDLQGCQDNKQRAERMSELQERRRSLQALLNTRLAELRRVCLQEAELTGEIPSQFPLETGERPPYVRRRVAATRNGSKQTVKGEDEEVTQRKSKKTLFSGALRRHTDSEQQPSSHGKRTVHRGCHTDNAVKSESSSTSDSTGQDNDEVFSGVSPDCLSPSRPRLAPGSPDSRFCRKLSPVEIYYEMRTRRNSVASSASPNRSLPRSVSNLEGRSVPATPLLSRTAQANGHIRSDVSSGATTKHWSDNLEAPQVVPLQSQEGLSPVSYEQGSCSYGSQTRRSNSSEALLDRTASTDDGSQRNGMPVRGGPYKSSEALTDGRLRQVQQGSPDRQLSDPSDHSRARGGCRGSGYNDILLDYVWGKQQKMQLQQQQRQQTHGNGKARVWPDLLAGPPPHYNGFAPPLPPGKSLHFSMEPPAYSPLMLRGKPGDPRRVKVTRTKSCGPFVPLQQHQQESILLKAYSETPNSAGSSTTALYPNQSEPQGLQTAPRGQQFPPDSSASTPEDATRSLHKALALEGLRDWYLRNTLGHAAANGNGHEGAPQRRRTTASLRSSQSHLPLTHQPQSYQGEAPFSQCQSSNLPQSATFHGHPLHGRSVELSLYQESFSSKMQELTLKESNTDRPTPGTLV
ncbi:coiled-coil domain-containing protein 120-like [Denticeps clupeoides]|uniref:coiled-coil domain-containing protein 120-like n=1 Tax=Denticeps clupeoides TaxID=299321 RepID=UPI0010A4DDA2|nr:coiled-coil domain-containing protein 120-like [Denticeps clupeoides]XP_028820758.1 coiled-coil domain-containing protein 120-like [Denticeps clupeoides]